MVAQGQGGEVRHKWIPMGSVINGATETKNTCVRGCNTAERDHAIPIKWRSPMYQRSDPLMEKCVTRILFFCCNPRALVFCCNLWLSTNLPPKPSGMLSEEKKTRRRRSTDLDSGVEQFSFLKRVPHVPSLLNEGGGAVHPTRPRNPCFKAR